MESTTPKRLIIVGELREQMVGTMTNLGKHFRPTIPGKGGGGSARRNRERWDILAFAIFRNTRRGRTAGWAQAKYITQGRTRLCALN